MGSDREQAVVVQRATRRFGSVTALADVTLQVATGEVVAVVGPSGCGKSTLLELVCGLESPDEGTVTAAPAALMAQRDLLLPWASALDNAALPLRVHGAGRREARAAAAPTFAAFGLAGFEGSRPAQLSGGMRQRVAFLRTLLAGKPVLCLDEPFAALDAIARAEMQAWLAAALQRWAHADPATPTATPAAAGAGSARTVLLVTHDVEEAVLLADRVVVLSPRPGRVVAELPVDLPRPRAATDPGVVVLRAAALDVLRSAPVAAAR
jgi:ABC-type nitrate/sulfonate/bicarbonate transport system ATPase subunit